MPMPSGAKKVTFALEANGGSVAYQFTAIMPIGAGQIRNDIHDALRDFAEMQVPAIRDAHPEIEGPEWSARRSHSGTPDPTDPPWDPPGLND